MMENKELVASILQRADKLKQEKAQKKRKIFAVTSCVLSVSAIILLALYMPSIIKISTILSNHSAMGTIFSNNSYVGYMIIGFISFLLGIIITILCYKYKTESSNKSLER